MKGYFQTTTEERKYYQNNGHLATTKHLICIPKHRQAFAIPNHVFFSSKTLLHYIFITSYLKEKN